MSPWRLPPPRAQPAAFTLVELLVVVLIIGILAAIALPRFLGQRTRTKNAAAQAAVRHALLAARSYYTQNSETYAGLGASQLQGYESSLSGSEPADTQVPGSGANPQSIWIGNGIDGTNPASGDLYSGKTVVLCSASKGDTVYCIRDVDGVASYRAVPLAAVASASLGTYIGSWNNMRVTALMAGAYFTCALINDGTLKCWGNNGSGQLGDGTFTDRSSPAPVGNLSAVSAFAPGWSHVCAQLISGGSRCWGHNQYGQLGDGPTSHSSCAGVDCSATPVTVGGTGVSGALSLSGGGAHSCAFFAGGSAKCWGRGDIYQLGNSTNAHRNTPTDVTVISGETSLLAWGHASCALTAAGAVSCWGWNNYGQLGVTVGTPTQTAVTSIASGVKSIGVGYGGYAYICALMLTGTVQCSGDSGHGVLGDAVAIGGTRASFAPVNGITNAVDIYNAGWHSCVILADRTARCWGYNNLGQLGNGTSGTDSTTPVQVSGISGVASITGGYNHTCALLYDGSVWCWGGNAYGQLGLGDNTSRSTPVEVKGL